MPPRQGHRKSRGGCQRCKRRKVKCDEKRPVCSGCARYPRACIYVTGPQKAHNDDFVRSEPDLESLEAKSTSSPSDAGLATPYSDIPISDIEPDRRRVLELLLLHHFENSTMKTFPLWRLLPVRQGLSECVHMAFEHDNLLHALFAVTALHLAVVPARHSGPNHDFNFERAHRIYLNMATREQRTAVSKLSEENARAVTWTSILMSYISLNLLPEDSTVYVVPFQWMSMSLAISTIYQATMQWRSSQDTLEVITRASGGPDFRDEKQGYDYAYGEPFRTVMNFYDSTEVLNDETRKIYNTALAFVAKSYSALTVDREGYGAFTRRCLAFAPVIGPGFVKLVGQGRPRALVILAYHCAMTKAVDEAWFFRGVADREVDGTSAILPPKWQWAMEWPRQILDTIEPIDCVWRDDEGLDLEIMHPAATDHAIETGQ